MRLSNHTSSAKSADSYKRQHEAWRRAYADTLTLRERFPGVDQLSVHMTFTDAMGVGKCSAQMRGMSASAKAFFAIPCPRTLCLDGGFDLDAIVVEMIDSGVLHANGTLVCAGWVDPKRADHARCQLHMHYRVEVNYLEPPRASSRRRPPA